MIMQDPDDFALCRHASGPRFSTAAGWCLGGYTALPGCVPGRLSQWCGCAPNSAFPFSSLSSPGLPFCLCVVLVTVISQVSSTSFCSLIPSGQHNPRVWKSGVPSGHRPKQAEAQMRQTSGRPAQRTSRKQTRDSTIRKACPLPSSPCPCVPTPPQSREDTIHLMRDVPGQPGCSLVAGVSCASPSHPLPTGARTLRTGWGGVTC